MNNINDNFLEDEQMVEEIVEEFFEEEEQENEILSEAEKRIEQANLYQALLKHDLFGPGSARPEIIDSVRKEFKSFILSRLELLLGINQDSAKHLQQQVVSPFSEEELTALKAIANRLVKKEAAIQPSVPTVNSINPSPINTIKPMVNALPDEPTKTVKKIVKKTIIKKHPNSHVTDALKYIMAEPESKKNKRKTTQNVSDVTGQDYSQAVADDPSLKPKAMPSQAEMDMINARQAEMNSRGASPVAGETGANGLGAKIAAHLLKS